MTYLLDTNVLSELRKPLPDPRVRNWFDQVSGEQLYLSVLVIGEIRSGVERLRRRDLAQAARFDQWLTGLQSRFSQRILPISREIADRWGQLNVPDPLPIVDGLLAATALIHALTMVTRNTRDFVRTGVAVLNPFEGLT